MKKILIFIIACVIINFISGVINTFEEMFSSDEKIVENTVLPIISVTPTIVPTEVPIVTPTIEVVPSITPTETTAIEIPTPTPDLNIYGFAYHYNEETLTFNDTKYNIVHVDGGSRNGSRSSNVAVDIGFGGRVYWGLTNEHGQLVHVLADEIVLQDENTESVNSEGRYYDDEANVPGTEHEDLDQGHVIADSLGGVANAYNITPQDSNLNRHGDQAYMERGIRDAGGATNFIATITYPNTTTQTPSHYRFEYILMGSNIVDEFDNINPDQYNEENNIDGSEFEKPEVTQEDDQPSVQSIDTNRNGTVTIAEAKAAGFSMPICEPHWLYQHMRDGDKDGCVGE